jgi:macrolide transport system ATP-binding/permease protein
MSLSNLFKNIFDDIRFALRVIYKNRSFAITAILALALGSSVGISIYTLLYGLVLRPFPVKEPESVTKIYQETQGSNREVSGSPYMFSYTEYTHYRDHNNSFSDLIAYAENTFQVGGAEGVKVPGLLVTTNYFPALGARMMLGRSFNAEEGQTPGASPVAVMSHRLWEQRFNSDQAIVGKVMIVNGVALNVIGVAAPETSGTELTAPDIWVPLMMEPQVTGQNNLAKQNCSWLTLVGRLKPGVSIKQAQSEMSVLASQLDAYFLDHKTTVIVSRGSYMGSPEESQVVTKIMAPITIAVAFILLIVCTNVSNLFLARAAGRQKELGVRLALGASRGRLIQQLLTESLLIGIIGGALGLALASWLLSFLKAMIPVFPAQLDTTPDFSIFACALLIALLSGLSSGLVPAISATRLDLNSLIKQESMGLGGRKGASRLRNLLLVVQLAGCLLLLISTTLLMRGLYHAKNIDLGFQSKNLYLASLDLRQQKYDDAKAAAFYRRLSEQLQSTPGIKSVSLAATPPLLARSQTAVSIERNDIDPANQPVVFHNVVSPSYFDTMGIKLLRGRNFSEQDSQGGASLAIVSEGMAQRYWPGTDPVGQYFKAFDRRLEVVGVARNIRNVQLQDDKTPFFYSLARPEDQLNLNLMLRVEGNNANLLGTLSTAVKQIDPGVTVSARSMEDGLETLLQPSRISILLTSALGLLALILATVGVYGVTTYAASQRTREIGIRMVLGAQRSNIIMLFIKQGMWPIATGVVTGLVFAGLASTLLSDLLFGVNSLDPLAFVGATAFLTLVALVAIYLPAWRATKRDAMVLIR